MIWLLVFCIISPTSAVRESGLFIKVTCDLQSVASATPLGINIGSLVQCSSLCLQASWCWGWSFNGNSCIGMALLSIKAASSSSIGVDCFVLSELAQVVTVAGFYIQYLNQTGYVKHSGINSTCTLPPRHPFSNRGTSGAVINGKITLCGGVNATYYTAQCFYLDPGANTWMPFPAMSIPRYAASSVVTAFGWWIAGGSGAVQYSATSDLFNATSSTWISGPTLPSPRDYHCMCDINGTASFLVGGFNLAVGDAWIYNWLTNTWTQLANYQNSPKFSPSAVCISQVDHDEVTWGILVAGGYIGTEVSSFNLATMTWSALPNLPSSINRGKFIRYGPDLLYLVNNNNPTNNNIMMFNGTTSTFSIVSGLTAGGISGTGGATVVALTDAMLHC